MSTDEYPHPVGTHFENPESSKSFALGGKIMLGAIVILICVVFFMVALHLYARWYLLRARRRQLVRRRNRLAEARRATQFVFYVDDNPTTLIIADPGNMGLDSSVLRSLPVFNYSPKTHPESLDCAVCLSEFEDGEKGRLLPKCNHAFHIDCIDMWFNSHSTCPLCRSPVERVSEPEMSGSGLTPVEPAGSSSALCEECHHHHHEEGNSSTTSLGSRRKGFDVRIEVPNRNEFEDELTLSSPASGAFRSPGARLFSQSMKRILSMGGRKTPTGESSTTPQSGRKTPTGQSSTTPSGAATSCSMTELDLEQGRSELPPSRTPK